MLTDSSTLYLSQQGSAKLNQPTGSSGGYRWDQQTPAGISRLSRLSTLPAKPLTASSLFFSPVIDRESWGVNDVIFRLKWCWALIQLSSFKQRHAFLFHSPLVFCIIGCPCSSHWSPLFWQCICCASQGSPPAVAALSMLWRPTARDAPPEVSSD